MNLTKLILAAAAMILLGCGDYSEIKTPFSTGAGAQGGPDQPKTTTELDFATIRAEILEPHCISCHTNQHDSYTSYSVVRLSAFAMLQRMKSSDPVRRMPKDAAALDPSVIARFEEWVNAGAPEFASEGGSGNTDPVEPTETISFEQIKTQILEPYRCTACHSQYNDYQVVKNSIGSIVTLTGNDRMPLPDKPGKSGEAPATDNPLTPQDKELLLEWVNQGVPEFSDGTSSLVTAPEELKPTWISLRNNVIGPKCVRCHSPYGNRGAGLALDTFNNILDQMRNHGGNKNKERLIVFDDPENSRLIGAILGRVDSDDPADPDYDNGDDEFFFDPMPFNNPFDDVLFDVPAVTDEELDTIREWIRRGAPYDDDDKGVLKSGGTK
ncbi:MAG: c-type cytochrome domain-containing protein [Pseudomonadota bacterium]